MRLVIAHFSLLHCTHTAENVNGTLNGEDGGDQTVSVGESKQFVCDMLPVDAAERLHGKWTAYVNGQAADIVSVNMSDGRAVIVPRDPPGFYTSVGEVQVQCVFSTPTGDIIYEFNRTISVEGACFSVSWNVCLC